DHLQDLTDWFSMPLDSLNPLVNPPDGVYDLPSGIVHYLNLSKNIVYENGTNNYRSYYFPEPEVIDIAGYRTLQRVYFYHDNTMSNVRGLVKGMEGQLQFKMNDSTHIDIPLNEHLRQLARTQINDNEIKNIEDATLYFQQDSIVGRLIINNITFGQDSMQINQLDGMLYLK
ncbi:MAG: hypothetical protein AB8G22_28350, partial [Saprospiraceae bacterium]